MTTHVNTEAEQIFAKIDAWWSEWIDALDSIDDAEKLTPGVCDDWSVKDLMAHMAVWDIHAAEVAEALAAGRERPDIDGLTGDEFNAEMSARDAGMTLQEARSAMDAAHADMLARLRAVDSLAPELVAEDTYGHYPDHVDQVLFWRNQTADVRDAGLSASEVIDRINATWATWLEVIEGIDPAAIDEAGVCGSWSTKDLIGHVAVWDREAAETARRESMGEAHPLFDWRRVNENEAERRRNSSLETLTGQMHAVHADLMTTLADSPALEASWVADNTYEHYPQHIAQIRAWRRWRSV
jgi:mycothiol maleylpyruvate isomerase-like protein